MSRFRLKVTMTKEEPEPLTERSSLMPSIVLTDFLDGLGDLRFHLRRRGAGQRASDADGGKIHRRESGPRPDAGSPPTPTTTSVSTIIVAKTGRRMQISASFCMRP